MEGEFHQLASAMLVLAFAAVMLVTGLLFIERSGRSFDAPLRASVLRPADDGFMRAAVVRPSDPHLAQ
jgi:hypothetical protein